MKKVFFIIFLSLALVGILVSAIVLQHQINMLYLSRIIENRYQVCDIETTVKERCYISIDINTTYEIKPGESIHVYGCWNDGQVYGEYVSEEGESYSITRYCIEAEKTDSEELKQLVKSMNENIKNLGNEMNVVRIIFPCVFILLFVGVLWACLRRFTRSHAQESSNTSAVKERVREKVLAIIAFSLTFVITLAGGLGLLYDLDTGYYCELEQSWCHDCDIHTTLNKKCTLSRLDDTSIVIEPGETIYINYCWAGGQIFGEYVSEEGQSYHISHSDITAEKTNSEELKQLLKSMNDNMERLRNERAVIRVVIPVVIILLVVVEIWGSWMLLRHHHVSK